MNAERGTTKGAGRAKLLRRLDVRLAIGVLSVAVLMMAGQATILGSQSLSSLTNAAENGAASVSRAVSLRLEAWMEERRGNLEVIAGRAAGRERDTATQAHIAEVDKDYGT